MTAGAVFEQGMSYIGDLTVRSPYPYPGPAPRVIAIIGAGISGLALGHHLRAAGIPYTILEASDRVGGIIRTERVGGHVVELGPQRLRASPELEPFLDGVGELRSFRGVPTILIARRGALHPLPRTLRAALATRAVSSAGKLRALLEPATARVPVRERMSAGKLLRRRVGREAYEVFLGPLFGGLYGSDPDRMDAARTLIPAMDAMGITSFLRFFATRSGESEAPGLFDRSIIAPVAGMEALPKVMAAPQRDAIRLSTPVTAIEPDGEGFHVTVAGGASLDAEQVVLTTPPGAAAPLVEGIAPELARALAELTMNPLALVHVEVPRLPEGLGFQVAFGERTRMRGATFSGNLTGNGDGDGARRTAVVFMGGMADPGIVDTSDQELSDIAAREFEEITGIPAHPIHLHRTAMPAWDRSWDHLDGVPIPDRLHMLSAWSGRPGILGRLREAARLAAELRKNP